MPITLTNADEQDTGVIDETETLMALGEQTMLDAEGDLTIEGASLHNFFESLDLSQLWDDEGVREYVIVSEGYGIIDPETNEIVEAEEGDEGAIPVEIETIPANVAVAFIDEDDLAGCYAWHVAHEINAEDDKTVRSKAIHERLKDFVGGEVINEYKRGAFAKFSKAGGSSRRLVNRMLGAMLAKGDIHRAKAGNTNRYHAPGSVKGAETYTKAYSKAGHQNPTRLNKAEVPTAQRTVKNWMKYRATHMGKIAQAAKKTLGARTTTTGGGKVTSKDIQKITTRKSIKSAMVKKGGAKKSLPLPSKKEGARTGVGKAPVAVKTVGPKRRSALALLRPSPRPSARSARMPTWRTRAMTSASRPTCSTTVAGWASCPARSALVSSPQSTRTPPIDRHRRFTTCYAIPHGRVIFHPAVRSLWRSGFFTALPVACPESVG